MQVRFYSRAERERLHPAGVDMVFGGSTHMHPESADGFAYGLVVLDRATGMYRRAQMTPVDERMIIAEARARQAAQTTQADMPAPWSSGRP